MPRARDFSWRDLASARSVLLIWAPIAAISILHYSANEHLHWFHDVLRRLYFSVEQIREALAMILFTLPEGGHLLLIDNPRVTPPVPVRGCLYRRTGDRFEVVGRTGQTTEIHSLVLQVRAHHLTSSDR